MKHETQGGLPRTVRIVRGGGILMMRDRTHEHGREPPLLEEGGGQFERVGPELLPLHAEQGLGIGCSRHQGAVTVRVKGRQGQGTDAGHECAGEGLVRCRSAGAHAEGVGGNGTGKGARPEAVIVEGIARPGAMLTQHREPQGKLPYRVHPQQPDGVHDGGHGAPGPCGGRIRKLDEPPRQGRVHLHDMRNLCQGDFVLTA